MFQFHQINFSLYSLNLSFTIAIELGRQGGHQFSHLDRLIISPVFISSTWKPTHWLPICSLDHLKMARGSAFQLTWREHILTKLEIETSKILAQRCSVVCARIMRVYAYCTQIRTSQICLTNLDRSKIWAVGRKKWFAKVVFGREFPQKNVAECLFRHILQDTIFL